jgi:hypothetical protein
MAVFILFRRACNEAACPCFVPQITRAGCCFGNEEFPIALFVQLCSSCACCGHKNIYSLDVHLASPN